KVKKEVKKNVKIWSIFLFCQFEPDAPYGFDVIYAADIRIFLRRLLMCCFKDRSVQSGVSRLILSSRTLFAITCLGFAISSFKMAYSVRVSFTACPCTAREREPISKTKSPTERNFV